VDKKTQIKAILAAIACHVAWGFSFLASRKGLDAAPVFVLLSHRFGLSFLVMNLLVLLGAGKLSLKGKALWKPLLLGLMEPVIYFFGEQYGILHSNTVFSGVMIAMIPIVSTLAAAPILQEKPSAGQLFFCLLSVCGVVGIGLMNKSSGALDWIGVVALIVAVLSAGAYTLIGRGISRDYTPFERTYMMIGVGAVTFTPLAFTQTRGSVAAYFSPLAQPVYLAAILFLALICSVACYFLSGYAITHMTVARETVFANLTTAVSVFAGVIFLHEPFTWFGVLCCLVIFVGIYGVQKTAP
jgi:drug/metabolite transporter (DMT)-like permease